MTKEELIKSDLLKKTLMEQMEQKAKEFKLSGIERVKKIHITMEPFSVTNDLVTPTFKLKRFNAKNYYAEQIK
jgi:long-chain acyl-CoA synthetase